MKKLLCVLILMIFLLLGCAPRIANFQSLDSNTRPAKTGKLDVFASAVDVKKPYREIALIEVIDARIEIKQNYDEMFQTALSKAREIGADGITIISKERLSREMPTGLGGTTDQIYLYGKVKAIVYQ